MVAGQMRLQFEITPDGTARNVIASPLGTPTGQAALFNNAVRCIEQRARAFAFARTASGSADLVITMTPGARGGSVAIERRTAGLTATAPGMETGGTVANNGSNASSEATGTPPSAAFNQQISEAVRARVGEIRTCYQGQLASSADLTMRTRVRFTIEPGGSVPTASSTTVVTSGDADAASTVAQCVEGVVRTTSFPARPGGAATETTLPFAFSPGPATASPAASSTAGTSASTAGTASGRIDPVRTATVIRENTDSIRTCYTRSLRAHPDLSGRVLVRFTVDPSGHVLNPTSQVTPLSGDRDALESVADCIEGILQSHPLPPPTGGAAAVALPFDFSPTAL
jgi:outer membrane biosynthesis protein TonB